MEHRNPELLSPHARAALSSLFERQRTEILEIISQLSPDKQRKYIKMLAYHIRISRRKIEGNFVPDNIKNVFEIVAQLPSVQHYALLNFLLHIRDVMQIEGDLTTDAVLKYFRRHNEIHFPGVGKKLLAKIKEACTEAIRSRESK